MRDPHCESRTLSEPALPHSAALLGALYRRMSRALARRLLGLALVLVHACTRAHRAGYLGLAQVEYCLQMSAKMRLLACSLAGIKGT